MRCAVKRTINLLSVVLACFACAVFACDNTRQLLLKENLARWNESVGNNYSYTLQRHCFCQPEYREVTRVVVKDGRVASAQFVSNPGKAVSTTVLADLYTIEQWFDVIETAIERNADRLEISYDDERGFPQVIDIDMRKRRADDEQRIVISNVVSE